MIQFNLQKLHQSKWNVKAVSVISIYVLVKSKGTKSLGWPLLGLSLGILLAGSCNVCCTGMYGKTKGTWYLSLWCMC